MAQTDIVTLLSNSFTRLAFFIQKNLIRLLIGKKFLKRKPLNYIRFCLNIKDINFIIVYI